MVGNGISEPSTVGNGNFGLPRVEVTCHLILSYNPVDGEQKSHSQQPVWMVLKHVVNYGISTTCPSTGEFAGFLNYQQ